MKVHGVEIATSVINDIYARMQEKPFMARDLACIAKRGLPQHGLARSSEEIALRVADRIIQKERYANRIELSFPVWKWRESALK